MAASTKFLPKVGGGTCPNLYKMVFGGVGLVSGFVAYCMKVEETRLRAKLAADQEKQDKQEDPYTIWGPQAYMYPWVFNYQEDWENRVLTMRGYFKDIRFFVSRKKEGKEGFAVFAPFVTSHCNTSCHPKKYIEPPGAGIMVNMGWIPQNEMSKMEADEEPLGKIDFSEMNFGDGTGYILDPYTMFKYKNVYDDDREYERAYVDVTGVQRRGETPSVFAGNINIPRIRKYCFIDVLMMKCYTNLINRERFDDHYLERIVDEVDDVDELPIPATKSTLLQGNQTPELYARWATQFGGVSVLSLITFAAMIIR